MKYVTFVDGTWDHRPYWRYLNQVAGDMPENLFAFAVNPANHDLKSSNSLHDAWLARCQISEDGGTQQSTRRVSIDLVLLGSQHDRFIHLGYRFVTNYQFNGVLTGSPTDFGIHGDLLVHEVRIVKPELFEHEILFANGTSILVQFLKFEYELELLPK